MRLIISMCLWVMLPFVILRILGYRKGIELGVLTCFILAVYLFSFLTGLLITVLFENPSGTYFRDYEPTMPKLYALEFKQSMRHDEPLIAWTRIIPWLLIDLLRVSTHFIFTHSKITMWIPMLMGLYIIYVAIMINFDYLFPRKHKHLESEKDYSVDVFGNRNISLAEEQQEIDDFLEKAKRGRIT